jgi:long-chain acyl-CoA synthetase
MDLDRRNVGGSCPEPIGLTKGWWVFDVDGCLVDSLTGTSLRPGARELLAYLNQNSARVILWSAGGDSYAQQRARQFSLEDCVSGFFGKAERDANGWYRTDHLPGGCDLAAYVDDRPEDLAPHLNVIAVSPYLSDDPHDHGLEALARYAGMS